MPETKRPARTCLLAALLVTACLASWQALTVRYNYGGNWTGLYCAGSLFKDASSALHENIYRLPNSSGYDGQFYHLIAHDPFFQRDMVSYIDSPRYRYGRILVPGLAYVLVFGHDALIDPAYLGLIWLSVFAGCYWLGRYAVLRGHSGWWGLAFALVPAVPISIDRLTVDIALATLCVGFALYVAEGAHGKLYALLAVAGLSRETGLLLVAAWCIWLAGERRWRHAAIFATAAIPTFCWLLFVRMHTPAHEFETVSLALFSGIVRRFLHPFPYAFGGPVRILAIGLDFLALLSVAAAIAWAFGRACVRAWSPVAIVLYLFALLAISLSTPVAWDEVTAFARALTPLMLMAAFDGVTVGTLVPACCMVAMDPRIGLQIGSQVLVVARGLFR